MDRPIRCRATTESGGPCPEAPAPGAEFCQLHSTTEGGPGGATPTGWTRRDLVGGVLGRGKEARGQLFRDSGVTGALRAIRELVQGFREITSDVRESLEAKALFDDRASELPRDLERRGAFWFGDLSEAVSSYAWDPARVGDDLRSDDQEVREAARVAALRHGDVTLLPALAPLLEDQRASVRSAVLEIIGSWKDPAAVGLLTRRLAEDSDPATRVRAVLALKEVNHEGVVEPLIAAAGDREKMVRVWAGAALTEWLPRLTPGDLKQRVEAALARLRARPGTSPGAQRPTADSSAARPAGPPQDEVDR